MQSFSKYWISFANKLIIFQLEINTLGNFHAVSNHSLVPAEFRNTEAALQTSCIIKIHRAFMAEEPLKNLFQCYWWGFFSLIYNS